MLRYERLTSLGDGARGPAAGVKRGSMEKHETPEFRGTILIADDHEVFRFGLAQLLRQELGAERILEEPPWPPGRRVARKSNRG